MKKIDLQDVTFLIPIRLDSVIRIENLLISIKNLTRHFNTNIIVLEASSYCNGILKRMLPSYVRYLFVEDHDPIFYRTHYLNVMTQICESNIVAIWDADVILPSVQIEEAVNLLRAQKCDVALPYDGRFFDISKTIREIFVKQMNVDFLIRNSDKMYYLYGEYVSGGAIFVDREKYIEAGLENEKFYGWGPEDQERMERWANFNYRIMRVNGGLFHLTHPRDLNGTFNSDLQRRCSCYSLYETKKK